MPCNTVKLPGGMTAIVCSRPARGSYCTCGRRAPLVCDWPVPEKNSGTCDKPICPRCSRKQGERDYCLTHRGAPSMTQAEMDLAGEAEARNAAAMLGVPYPPVKP